VGDVRAATEASGHLRILVTEADAVVAVVHVRDALPLDAADGLAGLPRPVVRLPADMPVYAALTSMRETRTHLVLVEGPEGDGVVTLTDLLRRLFPQAAVA